MKLFKDIIIIMAVSCLLIACGKISDQKSMDQIAEEYVKLVLAYGEHEAGYVDYYYGPDDWANAAKSTTTTLEELKKQSRNLIVELELVDSAEKEKIEQRRHSFLIKQLIAVETRIRMATGENFTFDEETRLLSDAVSPAVNEAELDATVAEIEVLLEGEGDIQQRIKAFRNEFLIPEGRLDAVIRTAIKECRNRTQEYMSLPANENFTLEFVNDEVWPAYNWYKGAAQSLIQINTDLPTAIKRAIYLGCHEAYPGHHVAYSNLEAKLVNERGWVEFSVFPLFSPLGFLMEGTANYGPAMAFPDQERQTFETEVLYPLAGIDPSLSIKYEKFNTLMAKLRFAYTEEMRRYLDGKISRDEAVKWMMRYSFRTPERA